LGIAFQIQDDILDYIGSAATGKALYNDIRECKITLPLLLAVENGGHRASVLSWLRKGNVAKVVEYVKLNKGVEASRTMMQQHHEKAIQIIEQYPPSSVRSALLQYAHYVTNRTK
ncbi:MAG: polyprenyl synthetase family protein, partial [Mucinivorans sp.]